ncbi:MAG: hypothetical protein HY856_13590 [Burkholderiales bacterium]|nr:hypothetical protein [Burkholderiales bacterium]
MPGALSYIAAGMGEGLGRSMVAMGNNMAAEQAARREQELALERDRQRQQAQEEMLQMRLAAQQQGTGGGRGRGAMTMFDVVKQDDETLAQVLRATGQVPPEQAADAVAMIRGQTPTQEVKLDPARFTNPDRMDDAAAGPQSVKQAKYAQGEGAALMQQAFVGLRRAVGLGDAPEKVAEAESTEQTTRLVGDYAKGNDRAGDAALVAQGKDPNAAEVRADATVEAAKVRASGGGGKGGGSGSGVQSTYVNAKGERVAIMRDGTQRVLGPDSKVQSLIQAEKKNLGKTIDGIGASDADLEARAVGNLLSRGGEGKPAQPASGGKPAYAEGTRLRGPDGKVYVVRGGKPVLEK